MARNVNWQNPHEACAEYRRLDFEFGTRQHSPLHHDNRCPLLHEATDPFVTTTLILVKEN